MNSLAFIPSRCRSRRLPRKNVREVGGVPMVVRAVNVAMQAKAIGVVAEVVVSLEDSDTQRLVSAAGAKSAWRSQPASEQDNRVIDVLRDFLTNETMYGKRPEYDPILIALPSSPLRTLRHVVESRLLLTEGVDAVMSVTPMRQSYARAMLLDDDRRLSLLDLNQGGPAAPYVHCGTVIWMRREALMKATNLYDVKTLVGYPIKAEEAVDVNDELDLRIAEMLAQDAKRACEGLCG